MAVYKKSRKDQQQPGSEAAAAAEAAVEPAVVASVPMSPAAPAGEAQLTAPAAVTAVQADAVAAVRLLFYLRRQCRLPLPELPPPARRPRLRQEGLPGQGLLHARRVVQVPPEEVVAGRPVLPGH